MISNEESSKLFHKHFYYEFLKFYFIISLKVLLIMFEHGSVWKFLEVQTESKIEIFGFEKLDKIYDEICIII